MSADIDKRKGCAPQDTGDWGLGGLGDWGWKVVPGHVLMYCIIDTLDRYSQVYYMVHTVSYPSCHRQQIWRLPTNLLPTYHAYRTLVMQGPVQYKAQKESPSLEDSSNIKILGGCHDLFSPYVGSELNGDVT